MYDYSSPSVLHVVINFYSVINCLGIRTKDSTFHEDHEVWEETYLSLCLCASSLKPLIDFNEIRCGNFILRVAWEILLPTLHEIQIELYQHVLRYKRKRKHE
jgi:hypothetical protein